MGYRRVVISRIGGPEVLQVVEEENLPQPQPGQVRIHVLAAGVARADSLMRRGRYPGEVPPLPYTPGYDVVGRVDSLAADRPDLAVGDMVAALARTGGYSEYICLPSAVLVKVPEGIDPGEAVCLVLNYLTAAQMLHRFAQVEQGQQILVHAAASGVGTALLQLAKIRGARVFATASTQKLPILEEYGAQPIDYTRQDFRVAIRKSSVNGVDAAFDPLGGSHLWDSFQALSPSGTLIAYGELRTAGTDQPKLIDTWAHQFLPRLLRMLPDRRTVLWYEMYPFNMLHMDWYREDLCKLLGQLADRSIQPVIAAKFPLVEAARAHEMLESRNTVGKIVLVINQ
jgi:NADPH:quinone reductase-like Zn-dependent oxidoreductase